MEGIFEFVEGVFGLVLLGVVIYYSIKLLRKSSKEPDSAGIMAISDDLMSEEEKESFFKSFVLDAIAGNLKILQETQLVLRGDEYLIFDLPDIALCEERSVGTRGGYQGFSIRVAKGVSYRFGEFSSQPERQVTQIDTGQLIFTNKRMVFIGEATSKDIKLNQINAIKSHLDGIVIARSGKEKMEYYLGTDDITISEGSKEIDWKLSGVEVATILRLLIED